MESTQGDNETQFTGIDRKMCVHQNMKERKVKSGKLERYEMWSAILKIQRQSFLKYIDIERKT